MRPLPSFALTFPEMPLWRGTQPRPGDVRPLPFVLEWDPRGFIRQASPPKVREAVIAHYADPDYQFITAPPGQAQAEAIAHDVEAALGGLDGHRVLEIGAGTLHLARTLAGRHAIRHYLVVDPALVDADGETRVAVARSYFPCAETKDARFDTVIGLNCLEHVDDPIAFLSDIRSVLAGPDARAYLAFPDIGRQFAEGDINGILHEHMSYFSADCLDAAFAAAGLRILARVSSLDCFQVVAAPADLESDRPARPPSPVLFAGAASFHRTLTATADHIGGMLASGRMVLFHGATNGLNIFLHVTGLGSHPGIVLVDADPAKEGRFLPACLAPIARPATTLYGAADLVVVSAMTYWEGIRAGLERDHGLPAARLLPLRG